ILATLVGTPWWFGWRAALAGEYRDPFPWWLGEPGLDAAERLRGALVTPAEAERGYRVAVPAGPDPPEIPPMPMAAGKVEKAMPGKVWVFVHPNKLYLAKFRLPAGLPILHEDAQRERPLHFLHTDTRPATELHGQPLTFGSRAGTVSAEGRYYIKLADL